MRWIGATVGTRRGQANGGWERKSGGRRTGACHMWQDTCGYTMRSEGGPENRLGHRNGPSDVRRGRGSIRWVNATAAGASAACARRLSSVPKIDWGAEMDPTMRAQVRNARRGRGSERWVSTVAVGACGAHRGHPGVKNGASEAGAGTPCAAGAGQHAQSRRNGGGGCARAGRMYSVSRKVSETCSPPGPARGRAE